MPVAASASEQSSTQLPSLSPTFCYTPFALRTFLRQSRAITDDPISQQLSAFSQSSPSFRNSSSFNSALATRIPSTSRVPAQICGSFVSSVLLPAWNDRSRVLQYCADVARNDDESDPERALQEADTQRKASMVIDERLDPYSARFQVRESRRDVLRRTLREEVEIEEIVRGRSWGVLRSRCEAVSGEWGDIAPVPVVER